VSPLERTWLLGTAKAERDAFGRTIQYTPAEAWDQESSSAGWRNRDIVAHLAGTDVAAAALLGGEEPSEIEEFLKSREGDLSLPVDEINAFMVEKRREAPFRAVAMEWGRSADLLLRRAAEVPADDWEGRRVPWIGGEFRLPYLIQSRVMEWWLHGEDVLAGGDNPPRFEHPPIYCVNDLGVRLIPYGLGLAGLAFPGSSIRITLEGVGEGTWHWGLAPRETPPADKEPDAVITGRGYAFALVAGRRIPAEYYLAEGTLVTGGDDELAETVLMHLRAFA
jgi:uncharacterized protein (TIGR03083 family)